MPNNLDEIDLRSEEIQDILNKVPNWMVRWGNSLFLFIILFLLFLSWVIKYPDVIISEAIITTEIPPQKVYAKVSGKIDSILVKDQQNVNEGEFLAVIQNTANFSDVMYLKNIMDTLKIEKQSFNFPIDKIPLLILGEIEPSFVAFENNYLSYILNKELEPFSNEADANKATTLELKKQLNNLQSQIIISKKELDLEEKELQRSEYLYERGVISEKEFESKQLAYLQSQRIDKNLIASFSQLRGSIVNNRRSSVETEISRVKEEMNLYKKVIQSYNHLRNSLKIWELQYVLTARITGKVLFLNYWSENQTALKDDLVFTIIPAKNSAYIAKLRTPSQNLGKVKIGQTVNIMLENYPDYEFGVVKGKVSNISQVSDEEGFYTIDVSLPKRLLTSYNKEILFTQEMGGIAEIITEDLRLINRFFYQFYKAFNS